MRFDLTFTNEDRIDWQECAVLTAMRAVNSIPAVCEAETGIRSDWEVQPAFGVLTGAHRCLGAPAATAMAG